MDRVYLDHNATSSLRPEAARAVREALERVQGNPSSIHAEGRAARRVLEEARERVAALVQLPPGELVFTSGGSEALAAALRGVCERAGGGRRRLVISAVEHSAVLETAQALGRWGFAIDLVPCNRDGWVDPEEFAARLDAEVCLAALQWANNETGVIQPVEAVARACVAAKVPLLVDAVQAAGKIATDPRQLRIDLLALSGHKLGAPQGTGALAVRQGLALAPLIAGGAQEKRRRGGTEAVAALAGFGAAAEAARIGHRQETRRMLRMRVRIESRLRDRLEGVTVHGAGAPRLPNTVNFRIPGVPGESLAIALDVAGIAISTGSACASGAVKPSHVMRAMGFDEEHARGAVRVSLGWSTTDEEVERFLDLLPEIAARVRGGSTAARQSPHHLEP
jgi:cysteine desulfurase